MDVRVIVALSLLFILFRESKASRDEECVDVYIDAQVERKSIHSQIVLTIRTKVCSQGILVLTLNRADDASENMKLNTTMQGKGQMNGSPYSISYMEKFTKNWVRFIAQVTLSVNGRKASATDAIEIDPDGNIRHYVPEEEEATIFQSVPSTKKSGIRDTERFATENKQLRCTSTHIKSDIQQDKRYFFPQANIGEMSYSSERCPSGRPAAAVQCIEEIIDSNQRVIEFDDLIELPCNVTIPSLKNQGDQDIQDWLRDASRKIFFLSDWSQFDNQDEIFTEDENIDTFQFFNYVHEMVENKDLMVSTETLKMLLQSVTSATKRKAPSSSQAQRKEQNLSFIHSLESLCSKANLSIGSNWTFDTDALSIHVLDQSQNEARDIWFGMKDEKISFPEMVSTSGSGVKDSNVQAYIPACALEKGRKKNQHLNVVFVVFKDSKMFPSEGQKEKAGKVISIQVGQESIGSIEEPLWYKLPSPELSSREVQYRRCGYYNMTQKQWAYNGCTLVPGSNPPNCTCTHMTNFAVLVRSVPLPSNVALSIFTRVGCSLSIFGLLMMMAIHLYFRKLRQQMTTHLHLHLALNMTIAYVTFVVGVERPRPYVPCIITAAVIHFTLLSSWGWMTVECYTMYRKFVSVFKPPSSHYVRKAAILVYSIVILIVGIAIGLSLAIDNDEYQGWEPSPGVEASALTSSYVSGDLCWLEGFVFYGAFLAPVGLMLFNNLILFFIIIRAITWGRAKVQSNIEKSSLKNNIMRSITVSLLLGVAWIFAVPMYTSDDRTVQIVFSWLFTIANALQGFFIFLLFCIRRDDVRQLWWKPIRDAIRTKKRKSNKKGGNQDVYAICDKSGTCSGMASATSTLTFPMTDTRRSGSTLDEYMVIQSLCVTELQ